ncbi:LamB/YcsF family protein [Microbacterium halophytorum]|uniref:LamB/YcsF family protein n=1 Tax=Microbacterium halophytorum TaxID=2067568 RepID=UPI000CFC7DC9|nr:5-oxoprolinase subunit PxpA [Microbacterium halophytorum]
MATIDLNADMGESFGRWRLGDDEAMLDIVTSANVACGFHAGDPLTLLDTTRAAAERGVVVGAQPGYRDLAGFGRRALGATGREVYGDVLYQLGALAGIARAAGTRIRFVKPHGALYNTVASDDEHAPAVIDAIGDFDPELVVVGLARSRFVQRAEAAGLRVAGEAFADRAYAPDGTLVGRREPGAVLTDPSEIADRMLRLVTEREIVAVDGRIVMCEADSICVHGDTPGAVEMARAVRATVEGAGIEVRPFAG